MVSSSSLQFPTRSYRPLQCPTCKELLLNPVTLPCGFSVCQACLPSPQTITSQQQIKCPFLACSRSTLHRPDQLSIDVTLQNLTTTLRTAAQKSSSLANILSEDLESVKPHQQPDTLYYGTASSDPTWKASLEGLYDPYDTITTAQSTSQTASYNVGQDASSQSAKQIQSFVFYRNLPSILDTVRSKIQPEIECQICFLIFDNPITTYCGHTLCKSCLVTSLDYKPNCPLCRHQLPLYMYYHNQPPNKALVRFIQYLANYPNAKNEPTLDMRREGREIEQTLSMTPLFINSLVFPRMPCYLLVFEPRYRKLLRNVLKTQSRLFGMVLPPQQKHRDLDCTAWEPSMEYGTLLKVVSCELLPDGRALVETMGVSRFQILTYSMIDGYYAATAMELIHDMPAEQERELEKIAMEAATATAAAAAAAAQENVQWNIEAEISGLSLGGPGKATDSMNRFRPQNNTPQDGGDSQVNLDFLRVPSLSFASNNGMSAAHREESVTKLSLQDLHEVNLEALSRKQLVEILMSFVVEMQDRLGALQTQRLQREFGEMIEDEGQYLSFWVASVLPLRSYQKYGLLQETSVRQRLLTVLGWIKDIESRRSPVGCTIS